jgi:RNA polymerase sigma-70 factor, ECF subfamily
VTVMEFAPHFASLPEPAGTAGSGELPASARADSEFADSVRSDRELHDVAADVAKPAGLEPPLALGSTVRAEASLAPLAYDQHFDVIWRTLRRLGVLDHALDDALQDVLLIVHRRSAEFSAQSSLRTWVIGIAMRVASNYRRTQRRDTARHHAVAEQPLVVRPAQPDQLLARQEAVDTLYVLLERLPENQRELFVLVDLEQLSIAEAAELTGASAGACYKRLSAARLRFNAELERYHTTSPTRRGLNSWSR